MYTDFLVHHGIKGQEWGVRNGPPYPLKGHNIRRQHYQLSEKGDKKYTIAKGTKTQTLSYDKNRLNNTDMYFATLTEKDRAFYRALFNKKAPSDAYDENGKKIGSKFYLKYNLGTQAAKDVKMANEREGIEAFTKLVENSRDFSNFVSDKKRLGTLIDERRAAFEGYKEALDTLDKIQNKSYRWTSDDMAKLYRLFNYALGAQGTDIDRQKARFFKELKSQGYGAVLDTNDALYGRFHRESPAIIFDTNAFNKLDAYRTTQSDKTISFIRLALGMLK